MAYATPKIKLIRDNVLRIYHPEVLEPSTYLTASVSATGTTLTVKNNEGFSNTDPEDLLLIGNLGSSGSEIKRINGAITQGTSLTVQSLTFGHGIDTPVSKILFNKFEVSGASTLTGSKTIVQFNGANTNPIEITSEYTDFVITGTTYSYYFVRFYNSLASTPYYSGYSDGVAATDFDVNTVGFIVRNAFDQTGEKPGGIFSDQWIHDQIYLIQTDIFQRLKRWSWAKVLDYDMADITTGLDSYSLPSNIDDNKTQKSILGIRIANGDNLRYLDPTEFEEFRNGVAHTTLASAAVAGNTTLTLTDSNDFPDASSVLINGTTYSYTANNRSTNTLSGLTALSSGIDISTDVWYGITFGEPFYYTIRNGVVYLATPPSSDFDDKNIWIDYYQKPVRTNSDTDTITVNSPSVLIQGLKIKIKERKTGGSIPRSDSAVADYENTIKQLIDTELSGNSVTIVPQVPDSVSRNSKPWWNK